MKLHIEKQGTLTLCGRHVGQDARVVVRGMRSDIFNMRVKDPLAALTTQLAEIKKENANRE